MQLIKIVAFFFLATALFLTTALNSNNALAASNKSTTAYATDDTNVGGLLYSDSDNVESLNSVNSVNDFVSPQRQK